MPENARTTRTRSTMWRRTLAADVVLAATGSILAASPHPAEAALPTHSIADPVHYWNDVLQGVFKQVKGGPVPMARAAAMMNGAIYDAESSYQAKWKQALQGPLRHSADQRRSPGRSEREQQIIWRATPTSSLRPAPLDADSTATNWTPAAPRANMRRRPVSRCAG